MPSILLLLAMVATGVESAGLTQSYVMSKLVPAINKLILTYPPNDRKDVPESQAPYPLNGALLRLAFHDCAGAGGCDGCIGLSVPENAGLDYPVKALDSIYSSMKLKDAGVSRADLWALAGEVVVANRMKVNATAGWFLPSKLHPTNFKYGRKDCPTAPHSPTDVSSNFPGAFFTPQQVASYFALRFGYNAQQTVAIMGAHHIGRMHQRNSGFKGAWLPEETMDGEYYRNLVELTDWHQEVVNCSVKPIDQKVSWEANSKNPNSGGHSGVPTSTSTSSCDECKEYYMLDADIAIYKDQGTPKFNGAVSCSFSSCPYAAMLSDYTKLYASNGLQFQQDFASVFEIMLSVCGRQSSGAPNWCSLTTVLSSSKRAGVDTEGAVDEEDAASTGNAALYGLFALPVAALIAGAVMFAMHRQKQVIMLDIQDFTTLPEEAKQNVTPVEGTMCSSKNVEVMELAEMSTSSGSITH